MNRLITGQEFNVIRAKCLRDDIFILDVLVFSFN